MAIFIFPKGELLEIESITSAVLIFDRYGLYVNKMELERIDNKIIARCFLTDKLPKRET